MEILESPPGVDKGKRVAVPESPFSEEEEVGEGLVAEVARHFMRRKLCRSGPSSISAREMVIEVSPSLEGWILDSDPRLWWKLAFALGATTLLA